MKSGARHILYVSCLCSKSVVSKLMELDLKLVGQQAQKYHRLLVEGFVENGAIVDVLSYHKGLDEINLDNDLDLGDGNIKYNYIAMTTNKRIDYLRVIQSSYATTLRYLKRYKDAVVICDVLNISLSLGAILAARMMKRDVIGIITDFPGLMSGNNRFAAKFNWLVIKMCTAYVVLTEQMKERLSKRKKSIVIEGFVDINMSRVHVERSFDDKKIICIYAGLLHRKYGVEALVQAILKTNINNVELHLYGTGDYVETIEKINDPRIVYFGIRPNDEVVEAELNATLLINPRPTNQEFAKYSFPSKNMEYMVSGTPVLTTRLPGMPDDHKKYVFFIETESAEGIKEALEQILSHGKEYLYKFGAAAREFILLEKNNKIQSKKILDFLDDITNF